MTVCVDSASNGEYASVSHYRFLGSDLRSVIAVDNGSSDGSTEFLPA
jgi:hypothetical protein